MPDPAWLTRHGGLRPAAQPAIAAQIEHFRIENICSQCFEDARSGV